jgi:transcriptional regulator GlxA family with amidase domain
MTYPRRVIFLTYAGGELLDLVGPSSVFSTANRVFGHKHYDVIIASPCGGIVKHSGNIGVDTMIIEDLAFGATDTVLIVGAERKPLARAIADAQLKSALVRAATQCERIGSICSGVFVLAGAGLIDGKQVATHWSASDELGVMFPQVLCNAAALYVTDGKLWTSAGVTTGIDMALAMLEADHGSALKISVARQLVVYAHRPGYQSQFSDLLVAHAKTNERFTGLIDWLATHTNRAISVEEMADYVGMSLRTFHRQFTATFDETPGKTFENLRLDAARGLIEQGASIGGVTTQTGFRSESAFRSAFKTRFGVTPLMYRQTWRTH